MLLRLSMKSINAFHVFVIGAVLLYIGLTGNKTPVETYYVLGGLALLIFAMVPHPSVSRGLTYWNIIHAAHYLVIVPGLLYICYLGIGKNGKTRSLGKGVYKSLAFIGAFVMVYHGYKLASRLTER